MIKTQIQVPEEQYQALKDFAAKREWSLAETFRRGAELLLEVYPERPQSGTTSWQPPSSGTVGWNGLSAEALKATLQEDIESADRLQ